ncbi:MAG: tRNA uridine-5-carboxymethylaminomethyl(34) synthesis enzyme MnmG [Phycisphaeraceae bacterium]|nr:tRNA uridine-5-carboxymethylaminomethyl(34) synthesis enzyme MnmG [Phycisphaeraceae bacterium]
MIPTEFDCIVIGGGHAGAEAAHAAAVMGANTALMTLSRDAIAQMSCNPAIGGLAKGQIVREVDALGGLMGQAIDATGIQFRVLNRSKGPAVQSPRAQADKYQYAAWVRHALEATDNLTILEGMACDILVEDDQVTGVRCEDGRCFGSRTVIVTTGTFLRGLMHVGTEQTEGGRLHEPASVSLSDSLTRIGLEIRRLKTGTPPRLDASTVDLDKLEVQHGDTDPAPFSFMNGAISRPQIPCWVTYTNSKVHDLLKRHLDDAPVYSGQIKSTGPRYCPSIESKIVRFADKDRHQIFLEPEDQACTTIYCNGISTSFARDVQDQMIALIYGTHNARIVHYAYAIEYDYCPPLQLRRNLETRKVSGLFMAGQINGTSGYEEAAGQGLVAGVNAVRKLQNKTPMILSRSQAYIGVLIDDLLTKEIDEPYRMFTSRAEYRLTLRSDNADQRLTAIGRDMGLVKADRWTRFQTKVQHLDQLTQVLKSERTAGVSSWDILRRPQNTLAETLSEHPYVQAEHLSPEVCTAVAIEAKYIGYLAKQERLVADLQSLESRSLPQAIDYHSIEHLRLEAREKLSKFRPETLAQAARIGGITPADITVIQVYLKKMRHSP